MTGQANARRSGESPSTAKSSTMNGAQALASKPSQRRYHTGNARYRRVRGSFWFLPPETTRADAWGLCRDGSPGHTRACRGVTPATDVNVKAKSAANAGTAASAGVVPGAWVGAQVIQTSQRGSVA